MSWHFLQGQEEASWEGSWWHGKSRTTLVSLSRPAGGDRLEQHGWNRNRKERQMSTSSRIGAMGLLGVAFVVLKLTGVINWSWWLVTLPFWGGLALVIVILLIVLAVFVIKEMRK